MAAFISPILSIIDRVLPDRAANDAAKAALLNMQASGELQTTLAQIGVNQAEATNKSVFVAGWRPFVGWACGAAFVYEFIVHPMTITIAALCHSTYDMTKLPHLDSSQFMPVLLGMLGLGALRTFDKTQGKGGGS